MKFELIFLAIAPVIAIGIWIYIRDKYEKEPFKILSKYFFIGALISFIAIMVEEYLVKINIFNGYSSHMYMAFVVAALTEEGLKAIAFIPNILREKTYNEKLDGIIYSAFLSLGFATIENIIYVLFEVGTQAFQVGLIRGIISIPSHVMFGITMGYYVSKYKYESNKTKKREYLLLAILIPILSHGLFDFILMIADRWAIILFMLYIIFLWKINLDKLDDYTSLAKAKFKKRTRNRK